MSKVKKKKKGVIIFSEVGANKDNNANGVFNDGGEVGYNKADGTWVPATRIKDDWYLFDELGLSKEPHSKSNLDVHLQFHVDRQDIGYVFRICLSRIRKVSKVNVYLQCLSRIRKVSKVNVYLLVSL
ncbi:hypothetical protein Tco_0789180 [Tanacetum coccineum]